MLIFILLFSLSFPVFAVDMQPSSDIKDSHLAKCVRIEKSISRLKSKRDIRLKSDIRALDRKYSDLKCFKRHTEIMRIIGFK